MKKTALLFVSMLFLSLTVNAQTFNGKKAMKTVKKAISAFESAETKDFASLDEAKSLLDQLTGDATFGVDPKAWDLKAKLFRTIADQEYKTKLLNGDYKISNLMAPMKAVEAYSKILEISSKKRYIKSALKNLAEMIPLLNSSGISFYERGDHASAFGQFNKILGLHKLLQSKGAVSPLANKDELNNQIYLAAFTALAQNKLDLARPFYDELLANDYKDANLYDGLYKVYIDSDREKAEKYLNMGRELYPDDLSLLYTEINQALKEGKMDALQAKLKLAIEKDPTNISLYTTLGSVYDNLSQKTKDEAESKKYFDNALEYYNGALKIQNDNTDALYSIGALYYNKGANKSQELNELANDYSKEGLKKYDALKAVIDGIFAEALPWFKKVEMLKPSDRNTIIALKEIFARQNKLEISNIFKDRLEKLDSGEEVTDSYFKN